MVKREQISINSLYAKLQSSLIDQIDMLIFSKISSNRNKLWTGHFGELRIQISEKISQPIDKD